VKDALLLQQFARLPRRGAVKTRLQHALGEAGAYRVHCELLALTNRQLLAAGIGAVELWLDEPGEHPLVAQCLDAGAGGPLLQRGRDLGERMANALRDGLDRADAVLLVGSDCPELDSTYLSSAAAALESAEIVFGPAEDGGFVLVGCRRVPPGLFSAIRWGDGDVLAQCESQCQAMMLACARLQLRYDIDRPEDLRRWQAAGDQA
jgi:rSAM/selenodomain-associated transferase 1